MRGWLAPRIEEICAASTFVCHKTKDLPSAKKLQCAGHMLLMGEQNLFVRFANRLKIKLNLSGRDLVFDTVADCVMHHKS